MYNTVVKQVLLYDCETWKIKVADNEKPDLGSNTSASRGLWVSSDPYVVFKVKG